MLVVTRFDVNGHMNEYLRLSADYDGNRKTIKEKYDSADDMGGWNPEKGKPHRKGGAQSRWPKPLIVLRVWQKGCQGETALPVTGFAPRANLHVEVMPCLWRILYPFFPAGVPFSSSYSQAWFFF